MKRLEDLADSPLVPSLLIKVHEEGDKKLMDVRTIFIKNNAYHWPSFLFYLSYRYQYKLAPVYQERMMPYLHELVERQIKNGLIR